MAWYSVANNSTGLFNFIYTLNNGMASQVPILGGNMFGLALLIPLWIIMFLPLAKFNVHGALVVSSFICWMVTVFLMAISLVNEVAFVIFAILTIVTAINYYFSSRQ